MYYIYILQSDKNNTIYIGRTNNLHRRIEEHNAGKSTFTKKYAPWTLVYLEGYFSEEDAIHREKTIKQFGRVYSQLKRRIKESIINAQKVRE